MDDHLSRQEQKRRKELSDQARATIVRTLPVEDADGSCVMAGYGGFYLQIAFSPLHPLMVFYLARGLDRPGTRKDRRLINDLNLKSVLGSHAINDEVGCYSYRVAHWLDTELTQTRFLEMLKRCAEEAKRAYNQLAEAHSFS